MNSEVGSLVGSIVLQRQHTNAVSTWFDGSVVVDHAANTTCTTQHTIAEDVGNSLVGIGFSTQGTTQFLSFSLSTIIHHEYPTLQDTQGTTQVVIVTSYRISSRSFLDDRQRGIVIIACWHDSTSQRSISIQTTQQIIS